MNEIIRHLQTLGVDKITIDQPCDDTVLYFNLYGIEFSPVIENGLTLDEFKKRIQHQYKQALKRQLYNAESEVERLKQTLLINFD